MYPGQSCEGYGSFLSLHMQSNVYCGSSELASAPMTCLVSMVNYHVKLVRPLVETENERKHQEERTKILEWLSITYSVSNYEAARRKHVAETGNWFLESIAFKSWKTDPDSFLWMHGIAGCGKTILRYVRYESCAKLKNRCLLDLSARQLFIAYGTIAGTKTIRLPTIFLTLQMLQKEMS